VHMLQKLYMVIVKDGYIVPGSDNRCGSKKELTFHTTS
jgi:hypothetical protein